MNLALLSVGKPLSYEAHAQVIVDKGVLITETTERNPRKWLKLFKAHGLVTIRKGVAIRHALNAQRRSADIIGMDDLESAGHTGEEAVDNCAASTRAYDAVCALHRLGRVRQRSATDGAGARHRAQEHGQALHGDVRSGHPHGNRQALVEHITRAY